jgi:hypothetical protein
LLVPDFLELDDSGVVVSELPVPDGLPLAPPLVLGDALGRVVPVPLMPLDPGPVVVDRVLLDEELLASRPSVASRSEQAPRPSTATAAATATPIARVFICFIFAPDSMLKVPPGRMRPSTPNESLWPSGRPSPPGNAHARVIRAYPC